MPVLLDPTLALTRRGHEWIDRVVRAKCSTVGFSSTFANPPPLSDAVFASYRPSGPFGHYWSPSLPDGRGQLFTVRAHRVDQVAAVLMAAGAKSAIAADLWTGLHDGFWLAARRLPTIDTVVQAGAFVVLAGSAGYERAVTAIAAEVGQDLAFALARRTRYFVTRADRVDVLDSPPPHLLVAFDVGRGAIANLHRPV
jgi:hypothetical protein